MEIVRQLVTKDLPPHEIRRLLPGAVETMGEDDAFIEVSVTEPIPGGVQCIGTLIMKVSRRETEQAPEQFGSLMREKAQEIIAGWDLAQEKLLAEVKNEPVKLEDLLTRSIKL